MATLFAITYPDPNRAKQAMESVDWANLDRLVDVKNACWISKEDGELAVHPWRPVAGKAASALHSLRRAFLIEAPVACPSLARPPSGRQSFETGSLRALPLPTAEEPAVDLTA